MKPGVFNTQRAWMLYIPFCILLFPIFWYAYHTPFALVDDYCDWTVLKKFSSLEGTKIWLSNILFHFDKGRYRPTFDLYNCLTWNLFGNKANLHHLARLLLKSLAAFFTIRGLCFFTKKQSYYRNLGIFAFLSIFFFFPNCPEARLAPQELLMVFFMSIIFCLISKVLGKNDNVKRFTISEYIILLLSFALLSGSKETTIPVLFIVLSLIFLVDFSWKNFLKTIPFTIIFVFTVFKVYFLSKAGGYGTAPVTTKLVLSNSIWYFQKLFLLDTSKILVVMLIAPIVAHCITTTKLCQQYLKANKPILEYKKRWLFCGIRSFFLDNKECVFYLFIILNFLGLFIITSMLWGKVIRYFYPLVYILALLVGLSLSSHNAYNRKYAFVIVICLFYFVLSNYYNTVYQFASQYSMRSTEQQMLTEVSSLLENNKAVNICYFDGTEFESNTIIYFNQYRPYFGGGTESIKVIQRVGGYDENTYYVTRKKPMLPDSMIHRALINQDEMLMLKTARFISSAVLFGKQPFYWFDSGAGRIKWNSWYIFRNITKNDAYGNNTKVIYENNERVELEGDSSGYKQRVFMLGEGLEKDKFYIVKVRYYTEGNPRPYIIVSEEPYRADNLSLHDKIPLLPKKETKDFAFSPKFSSSSPKIIFRNWSNEGKFVVTQFQICKIAAYIKK